MYVGCWAGETAVHCCDPAFLVLVMSVMLVSRNVFQVVIIIIISIYTLSDLGVLSNLIGSLSLANKHYSPPTG